MLNILWPIFIIISFAYAIFSGNVDKLNESIFSSTSESVNLCISLLGTICLWNGIMQIANKTSIIDRLTNLLKPAMNFLFPELKQEKEIQKEISLNVIANILGLGNAATPLGLKAMKSMQKKNPKKDTLTNSMITFIVLNTASLQIIPTTVIAIRSSMNSKNPTSIVFPVWIATICAAIAGITATKLFHINKYALRHVSFLQTSRKRYIKNDNNQDRHIYCIDDETDTFLRVQWFPIIHLHRKQLRTAERIEPVDQITEEHTRNGSRHDIRNEMNPKINPCISSKSRPEKDCPAEQLIPHDQCHKSRETESVRSMAGNKSVKSSPVSENSFHLIHKIRMVSRAETGEDRLTDVRGKLVAQRNDQYDRQ